MANLALFDLDMTLLNVDSDHSWGEFLCQNDLVDKVYYKQMNDKFYQDYIAGVLDATEYNEFVAKFLKTKSLSELAIYQQNYLETWIKPNMRPLGLKQINSHKQNGDTVVIISATNDFVVLPIAKLFGVDNQHTIATRLEVTDGGYTGKVLGQPNFKEGKIFHLQRFIEQKQKAGVVFDQLIAYSDSKNDLPLLEFADIAICVNPDEMLKAHATDKGWDVVDWQ